MIAYGNRTAPPFRLAKASKLWPQITSFREVEGDNGPIINRCDGKDMNRRTLQGKSGCYYGGCKGACWSDIHVDLFDSGPHQYRTEGSRLWVGSNDLFTIQFRQTMYRPTMTIFVPSYWTNVTTMGCSFTHNKTVR